MNNNVFVARGFVSALLSALVGFAIPLAIVLACYFANASLDTPNETRLDWGMPAALGISFVGSIFAFASAGFVSKAPIRGVTFPVCLFWIGGLTFVSNLMLPPSVPTFDGLDPGWSLVDLTPVAVFIIASVSVFIYGLRNSTTESNEMDNHQKSG